MENERKELIAAAVSEITFLSKKLQDNKISEQEYYSSAHEIVRNIYVLMMELFGDNFDFYIDLVAVFNSMSVMSMGKPSVEPIFSRTADRCLEFIKVVAPKGKPMDENQDFSYIDLLRRQTSELPKA